jgi:hypothetical protein
MASDSTPSEPRVRTRVRIVSVSPAVLPFPPVLSMASQC